MNDYLRIYKNYRTLPGHILHARQIVVDLIMSNEGLNKEEAHDKLNALINDDVRSEIEGEYNKLDEIIARNSG